MERVARREADRQTARIAEITPPLFVAKVTSTSPLQVGYRKGTVNIAGKNAAYSPVVGDWVHCSTITAQAFIDYKIG